MKVLSFLKHASKICTPSDQRLLTSACSRAHGRLQNQACVADQTLDAPSDRLVFQTKHAIFGTLQRLKKAADPLAQFLEIAVVLAAASQFAAQCDELVRELLDIVLVQQLCAVHPAVKLNLRHPKLIRVVILFWTEKK
jgi:hypothetical protein